MDLSKFTTVEMCDGAILTFKAIGAEPPQDLLDHRKKLAEEEKKKKEEETTFIVDSDTPIWDTLIKHYPYNGGVMPQKKKDCVEYTVAKLLEDGPDAKRPGLLLGKIQCGKTDTFEDIIGLAFDKGVDIAVVFQKGTNVLLDQTVTRFRDDFVWFKPTNRRSQKVKVSIFDIHHIENGIDVADQAGHKIVIACMKVKDNLNTLIELFDKIQPALKEKKILIVDDEADFASRNYNVVRLNPEYADDGSLKVQKTELELARIAQQIDDFVAILPDCRYLQVTATPYCLYLQADHSLNLNGNTVSSFKPRFTSLVPIHDEYVGADYFFDKAEDDASMFSHIYHKMSKTCIDVLKKEDRRTTKNGVSSSKIADLTYALVSYLMATAIRVIQDGDVKDIHYQSSAVIHVETAKKYHNWQEEIVKMLIDGIKKHLTNGGDTSKIVSDAIDNAYSDFVESNKKGHEQGELGEDWVMPSKEAVVDEMRNILVNKQCAIKLVNSDVKKFKSLLNEKGQLALTKTANIFIGGSILDRGITISNLICTIYGREPNQQDTVLQHARFYGTREMPDMAVTRLHTTDKLFKIMKRMNDLDENLRKSVANGETDVICLGYDTDFAPCASNKVKASDVITVKGGKRTLPIGFQTKSKDEIQGIVAEIETKIKGLPHYAERDADGFFEMTKDEAFELLKLIKSTYAYSRNLSNLLYKNDMDELMSTLDVCTQQSDGKLYGCLRTGRDIARIRLSTGNFENAPDGRDSKLTKEKATDRPVLLFLLEKGRKERANGMDIGWMGTEFFWPVLTAQRDLDPKIYANNQRDNGNGVVFDLDAFLEDIDRRDILRMSVPGDLIDTFGEVGEEVDWTETRELKSEATSNKYIYKNNDGSWELNPEANVDMDRFAGVYTYNKGRFPFVLRPFTHMLISNGKLATSDVMLVELNSVDDWTITPNQNFSQDGFLLDLSKKKLISAADILVDDEGIKTDDFNDNLCLWTITYSFGRVVKYQPCAGLSWDDED